MRTVNFKVDREAFDDVASNLTEEQIEHVVLKCPGLFGACYTISEAGDTTTEAKPEKPAARKGPPVDFAMVKEKMLVLVREIPGKRGEEYHAMLGAGGVVADGKTAKRALGSLVNDRKVYVDGVRRGARYTPVPAAAEGSQ